MNLSSHVPTSSSSAKSPIASKSPEILIGTRKPESKMRRNSKSDAASSSQARLHDAHLGGLMDTATEKPVVAKEESGDVDLSESETGSEEDVTGRQVAHKTATGTLCIQYFRLQGGPKAERTERSHNLHVSPATIHHTEEVFSVVRENYGREQDDPVDDLDVNMAIWRCHVDVDKLIVWKGLSDHQRQNQRLHRLCALRGKNGRWSYLPGRAKLNGIRKTITSRIWIESTACRRSSSGTYSQESLRWDSKSNDRPTVWTWALHRQDHLHVNVQRHWMESKRKQRKMWTQFTDSCTLCS